MINRRDFLKEAALGSAGLTMLSSSGTVLRALAASGAATSVPDVALSWLGGTPPLAGMGVSFGVPWPRGMVDKNASVTLKGGDGTPIPTQSWPLAYWPDGTLKWSGVAMAAAPQMDGQLRAEVGPSTPPTAPIQVEQNGQGFEIVNGTIRCRIARSGNNVFESLSVEGHETVRDCGLVAIREDRSAFEPEGVLRQENYRSRISGAAVEQSGPVRAVVRLEGMHVHGGTGRAWLPFTLRLYFTAGVAAIRVVHSFVFDGDEKKDFIRGLGLSMTVPFREERQNRHVRFATDDQGVWAEPVCMIPGYRAVLVKGAQQMNDDQLLGKRIPNLESLEPQTRAQIETVAVWDSFRLNQLAPDSFSIDKRTGKNSSWLHVLNGSRARGLAFLGDLSGGVAIGVQNFWQKYPSALEVTGATGDAGELRLWFWSPDAPAMDLRRYDTIGHDGKISYEDFQEGYGTPHGVANTQDLVLWPLASTPDNATFSAMARTVNEPPLLICPPTYYRDTNVLGVWSLPDRSNALGAAVEQQLDQAWQFYQGEIDRRRWYGFWDFGDVMRTYSSTRHGWLYDIGGHAWNNTELMPNAWLWFSFLRTGNAAVYRAAEAMTRHTSEVDVYHLGTFVGLGSRHNVNHWGCGAKEARISEAWLKRFYYYLTTDERTGDLMREVLTVDETIGRIQPLRKELVRSDTPYIIRIGPDWLALASNWVTEWERTGNPRYRDYVLTGMNDIGAMPEAFVTEMAFRYDLKTKRLYDIGQPNLKAGEFLDLFGGDQIAMDLISWFDCPPFAKAWSLLADKWGRDPKWKGYTKMRMTAYAAKQAGDSALAAEAKQLMAASLTDNGQERYPASLKVIEGPTVAEKVMEITHLDTPGVSQFALNLLTTSELLRQMGA